MDNIIEQINHYCIENNYHYSWGQQNGYVKICLESKDIKPEDFKKISQDIANISQVQFVLSKLGLYCIEGLLDIETENLRTTHKLELYHWGVAFNPS